MSSGTVKVAGRWRHGTFTAGGNDDEHSLKVDRYKGEHSTRNSKDTSAGKEARRSRPTGIPSHATSSRPSFHDRGHLAHPHRKTKLPGVKRSPARPEPQDRRSSSESRISGGTGAAASAEPRYDGSYSHVFPDRSSPSGVATPRGNARMTSNIEAGEKSWAHAASKALGRTSSNASEVQSPLRELPEHDLAEALEVEASLRQDLVEKPLSFSDTMGLKLLAPQEERPKDVDQPWANCRNEGAWSIAAGRPASPDSGESFAFPEVLPREVLQFADAPLKPLPDYERSGGEGGTPRSSGGPLEESWMHHRQQESIAALSPPKAAASSPPSTAAPIQQTAASPAQPARSPSPARTEAAGAFGRVTTPPRSLSGHSTTRTLAGSPGQGVNSAAGGRSPGASGGGRGASRERSLSPEPGALVRNPAHPLHAYSPWSAGLEAYATQLQGSCPRQQPPGSCNRSATPSPGLGSAPAARPACRSLRKQFEVAASPSTTSQQTPPGTKSPPAQQQQQFHTERASSAAPQSEQTAAAATMVAVDGAAMGVPTAHPGPTVPAAKRVFLGSAGMALTNSLRTCSHAGRELQSRIWHPVSGANPASPEGQQPGQQSKSGSEGVYAAVWRLGKAGWVVQGRIREGVASLREACTAEPVLEKSGERSVPSPAQISDAVTRKVVKKQLVFLMLAFLALWTAALLPIALVITQHAAAAAAAERQAPVPVVDNNDYTCLGLPDVSGLPQMWGQLLGAVRHTAGLAVAQPQVGQ